jgi:HK97 family phage prohead protease
MSDLYERTFALEECRVASTGDGRTVDAYAAVFGVPAEVQDRDGHYNEVLAPGSFDDTIRDDFDRFIVLFNHGMTIYRTPSEKFATPLGKPLEVRADAKGVFTRTRYNRTPLADEVLAMIENGDVTGQSFRGEFSGSRRARGRAGGLDTITRPKVRMREFGPGILPVYKTAEILGVRTEELASSLRDLDATQRAELLTLLSAAAPDQGSPVARTDAAGAPSDGVVQARDPWAFLHSALRTRGITS